MSLIDSSSSVALPLAPAGGGNASGRSTNNRLREVAGQVVGSAFYGTIFQMIRESPFRGKFGHGGRGEEVFSAQLHGVLAERMGQAPQNNLSEVLFKRLEKQQTLMDAGRNQAGGA